MVAVGSVLVSFQWQVSLKESDELLFGIHISLCMVGYSLLGPGANQTRESRT